MARRSLKPQLNQIRTWVRQGRTDAWIAHQLEVSVGDIRSFKRDHELSPADAGGDGDGDAPVPAAWLEEQDLRAEDDALVAAALEAELQAEEEGRRGSCGRGGSRRGLGRGRGRRRGRSRAGGGAVAAAGSGRRRKKELEGTFDHGEEGYGLWLDPAVQDDPVYAEHWAGHRPIMVTVEPDQIVITLRRRERRRRRRLKGLSCSAARRFSRAIPPAKFDASRA